MVGNEMMTLFRKAMETCPVIGDVRGKGFMLSVEIVKNKGNEGACGRREGLRSHDRDDQQRHPQFHLWPVREHLQVHASAHDAEVLFRKPQKSFSTCSKREKKELMT